MTALIAAVTAFIATNMDDLLISMFLYAEAKTKREARAVSAGKYLGIAFLVILSLLGAYGLSFVPSEVTGLFGLLPIILGVREWIDRKREDSASEEDAASGHSVQRMGTALRVAMITAANGADNIGVYIPLFAGSTAAQTAAAVAVFALMTELWCCLGRKLSALPGLQRILQRHQRVLTPIIYIVLGIYVILKNGLLNP